MEMRAGSGGKTGVKAGGKGYGSKVAPLASLDQRAIAMSDVEDERDCDRRATMLGSTE